MAKAHGAMSEATRALEGVLRTLRDRSDREDLLKFQAKEIDALKLVPGVEEQWAAEREKLRHASKLADGTTAAEETLYSRDGAVLDELGAVVDGLTKLAQVDPTLGGPLELVSQARTLV